MSLFLNKSAGVLNSSLDSAVRINDDILFNHLLNNEIFDHSYIDLFESILHDNLCDYVGVNITRCNDKINSLGKFGYKMMIARYFEILKNVINDYYLYVQSGNLTTANTINYLNTPYMNELLIILYEYINNTMNLICQNILDGINSNIDSNINRNMIVFIVIMIFVVAGFFVVWVPFQSRLKDDISRTKTMLNIIPDNILKKVEFLKTIS